MIGREGPGPERPGPDYPPEWDDEPAEDAPCPLCGLVPAEDERHRAVFAVGQTGEDAEEVCVGPDRRQLDYAPLPDTGPATEEGEPQRVILCGPPSGCTCPAVAWYCICGASPVAPDPWSQGPVPEPPF